MTATPTKVCLENNHFRYCNDYTARSFDVWGVNKEVRVLLWPLQKVTLHHLSVRWPPTCIERIENTLSYQI